MNVAAVNQCGQRESGPEVVVLKGVASSSSVREPVESWCLDVEVGGGVGLGRLMRMVVGRWVWVLLSVAMVVVEFRTGVYTGIEFVVREAAV